MSNSDTVFLPLYAPAFLAKLKAASANGLTRSDIALA
jgi:hypothetical protein